MACPYIDKRNCKCTLVSNMSCYNNRDGYDGPNPSWGDCSIYRSHSAAYGGRSARRSDPYYSEFRRKEIAKLIGKLVLVGSILGIVIYCIYWLLNY